MKTIETSALSRTDMEFIEIMRDADEKGKELIRDALLCTLAFGDDFLQAWGCAIDSGDRNKSEETLKNWSAKLVGRLE